MVSSCTGASPAAPPAPSSSRTRPSGPPDWPALRERLAGRLVLPGEPGYDTARVAFNTLFDGRTPAAVAGCAGAADVQACVEVARDAGVPLAARSGGHSYVGYSVPDGGLVADLGRMSGVDVAPDGTVEIGAGARLADVYAALAGAGRCLPAGTGPGVGIAGLALGGGIGVLARKFGLTCDRLVSARVVTADGVLRTVSAEREPELFWALRGGGGGNFGIVTSFTFATEPAPDLTVFSLRFPASAVVEVLDAWQRWVPVTPDELWSNCVLSTGSPPVCRVGGCFVGSPAGLEPVLAGLGVRPSGRLVQGKDFLGAMRYFAGGEPNRATFVASSRMLPAAVDAGRLRAIMDRPPGMNVLLDSFGGAIARLAPDATAFPHRTVLASAQVYASATPATRDTVTAAVAQVRDAIGAMTGNTGYVNYMDPGLTDWPTAYYGSNLPRLREVAGKYDPDGVFAFPQAVRP
jgi:FAD/FMN-containing dehydrogenase